MSQAQLLELAEQAVMLITPMIAGAALAKIGENTLDIATRTFKDIWMALQRRFAGDDEAESALRRYQAKPEASARQELLAEQIAARFASDAAALAGLQALVFQLQAQAVASPAGVYLERSRRAQDIKSRNLLASTCRDTSVEPHRLQ